MNPRFPLYVPTKGRHDSRLTSRTLDMMRVPYTLVIEEQEYDAYASVVPKSNLLVLDPAYQRDYDTCDDVGDDKSKGPGPARNFIWEHSVDAGHEWHWVMDDNIRCFYRLNRNEKIRCCDATVFRCMEDFVTRYKNVGMAGPAYELMTPRRNKIPPFIANTRIYSCNLIRNDLPFRWRGRYNEDTILSLDLLKAGWCTIQFNAFLQDKVATQVLKGGNTKEFYAGEGTLLKSQMQVKQHPDVSRLVRRYGRWHHYVDYGPYKKMKLQRRTGIEIEEGNNEYGLVRVPPPQR